MGLSLCEIEFIKDGVSKNIRADGRGRSDFRPFDIETNVVFNTNGSARVRVGGQHGTDIMVGVKAEIGEPHPGSAPDAGRVEFAVDCSSGTSPAVGARGGQELMLGLQQMLKDMVAFGDAVDLKTLCIIPGETIWVLYVDALILHHAGNLIDTLSMAVYSALQVTKVPIVTLSGDGGEVPFEFEVSDDPYATRLIECSRIPIFVSINKMGEESTKKPEQKRMKDVASFTEATAAAELMIILDATVEEEACAEARLSVAVNPSGNICAMRKAGPGALGLGLGEKEQSGTKKRKRLEGSGDTEKWRKEDEVDSSSGANDCSALLGRALEIARSKGLEVHALVRGAIADAEGGGQRDVEVERRLFAGRIG